MTISIRLNPAEDKLIRGYADLHGLSVSELMRQAVLEKIEEDLDLALFEEALEDFKQNPKTYTLDEVDKELGFR